MVNYLDFLTNSARELVQVPFEVVPKLVIAIAIFVIGWIVGWLVERILHTVFRALPFFDEALKNVGLEEVTKRAGIRVDLGRFFGVILKVFIIFIFLVASLDVLGLQSVNQFFTVQVLGYIPNVFSAALIVVIGLITAGFVGKFVAGTSRAAKVEGGLAAKITRWSIIILSVIIALGELGIASEIIQSMIVGIIAALSLGIGLAFGLGGQQAAADFLSKLRNDIERG